MESWFKKKTSTPEKTAAAAPVEAGSEPQPELLLTPEMEIKGDFEHISSPKEFIEAIDFNTLNDIFDKLVQKSAGSGEVHNSGHRVVPEKISFKDVETTTGEQRSTNGSAYVAAGEIELTWKFPTGSTIDPPKVMDLLRTLTHESTHIRGGFSHESWEENTDPGNLEWSYNVRNKVGVRELTLKTKLFDRSEQEYALNLNEAITENIGQHVLREYLLRTGNSSYLQDKSTLEEFGEGSYGTARLAFACVLNVLSERMSVSVEELWKGFVQVYMSGNQEVIEVVKDIESEFINDPEMLNILSGLVFPSNSEFLDTDYVLNATDDPEKYHSLNFKRRIRALKTRLRLLNNLKFESNTLGDALGLRK